jgi:hypothetical protein
LCGLILNVLGEVDGSPSLSPCPSISRHVFAFSVMEFAKKKKDKI